MLLIIHILIPLLCLLILKINFGKVISFSFIHIFFYAYIFLIYIRALEIYYLLGEKNAFLVSIWMVPLLLVTLTSYIKTIVFKSSTYFDLDVKKIYTNQIDLFFVNKTKVISSIFVAITILYYVDIGISRIALLNLFDNSSSIEVMNQRISGLTSNISPFLTNVYSYSRALFFPLYFSFISVLLAKKKIAKSHYFFIAIAGILFCLATTAKSPAVIFMLSGILGYSFAHEGKLNIKKIGLNTFLIMILPALIYPLLYGVSGVKGMVVMFESLWRRLTWIPSHSTGVYFDYFSTNIHVGFASNRFLASIFNVDYINVASHIYTNYFDSTIAGGLVNASFIGSFYADWGLYGVFFSTVLISIILIFLEYFFRSNNTLLFAASKSIVLIGMVHLMLTNFYSVSLGRGFISVPLLLIILVLLKKRVKKKNAEGGQYESQ